MVYLTINADDLGGNEGRTRAILEYFSRGLITRTTLIVNLPFSDSAVAMAKSAGVADRVGLHLNLIQGVPLTEKIRLSRLFCNEQGVFNAAFHKRMKTRLKLPAFERQAVAEELAAQMAKFRDYGLTCLHLDSHCHAHTNLAYWPELCAAARRVGFISMRLSENLPGVKQSLAKRVYKWYFNRQVRANFETVDYFGGLAAVDRQWRRLDGKRVEIMVHPIRCADGFMSPEPKDVGRYETTAQSLEDFLSRRKGDFQLL